jgi:hypothetical protein
MQINLNNPSELSLSSVKALLASKDDSKSRQIRISKNGYAFLSDDIANRNLEDIAFRLETLEAGNGYVGIVASQDDEWVQRIYNVLKENWPKPNGTYCDFF